MARKIHHLAPDQSPDDVPTAKPLGDSRISPSVQEAIDEAKNAQAAMKSPFQVEVSPYQSDLNNPLSYSLSPPHSDFDGFVAHFTQTFGTASMDFASRQVQLFVPIVSVLGEAPDESVVNAALAFIGGQQARDELEAAMAVQMLCTHETALQMIKKALRAPLIEQQERYVNMATKLQRTMATQIETMKRYRSNGEQTIRVQHQNVVVQDGGQAIVGDVIAGGGDKRPDKKSEPTS